MTAPSPIPPRVPPDWGGPLAETDYAALAKCGITRELADAAMLRRVNEHEGREIVGQKGKLNCEGIAFPYYWPGEPYPNGYRLRRDHPDLVQGIDGKLKQERKYLSAPGQRNRLYFPPGVTPEHLADLSLPIVIVEGEKKSLALWCLANYETDRPRFIPIAIAGVWNWRSIIGKPLGPNGERLTVKGPIPDFSRIPWNGRTVLIIFDANVHTNDSVLWARKGLTNELAKRAALVKLVDLPEDCGVNGIDDLLHIWGPARVLELIDGAKDGMRLEVVPPTQFESRPEGMFRISTQNDQLRETPLTNYQARIVASIQIDDGVETRREFAIEAELLGRSYAFKVPASEFTKMDWPIEKIGPAAITYPNQQQYARAAIQFTALTAEEQTIYAHTGWRVINGEHVFLHAGGAIGPAGPVPGIEVRLAGALSRYELHLPSQDQLRHAVKSSLRLIGLVSPAIGYPLLAATHRAVLGDADFSIHVAGETGAYKSELVALCQQHFGASMFRLNLPASWSSTGNALESVTFHAKDALLVIDDFAPQGNAVDVSRYHSNADRVFRAVGNHAGRNRLDASTKLREAKPPRALILSTGEDVPRGHSVQARLLVLELEKNMIQPSDLSACQALALSGTYEQATAAFVQWIATRYQEIQHKFRERVRQLRTEALQNASHARTPDIVANLQAAFELFLEFCLHCGVVGSTEQEGLAADCWTALQEAAQAQAKHHSAIEPTARYLSMLRSVLSSGRAHLEARGGGAPGGLERSCGWRDDKVGQWLAQGDCIGWVQKDNLYLDPEAAFRVVQMAGRDVNDTVPISDYTLRKRLAEKNLLVSTDPARGTLTVRRRIGGASRDVLHLVRQTLLPDEPDSSDQGEQE